MSSVGTVSSTVRAMARPRWLAARLAPLAVIAVAATALLPTLDAGAAQAAVPMGTAGSFAVLGLHRDHEHRSNHDHG